MSELLGKAPFRSYFVGNRLDARPNHGGALKRNNGNIGTLTTQSHQLFANYGVTNKINVIAHVPHVRTEASDGVLAGQRGWQDATVAVSDSAAAAPPRD